MATGAKTKPRKKASTASRSSRSKASGRGKATTSSKSRSSSSSQRSNGQRSTQTKRRSTTSRNGSGRIEEARKAVAGTAQDAGHAVGSAAGKAKVPLIAGGAALAGIAGGVAIGARGMRRRKVLGIPMPRRSVLKASTKNLANAAKQAGKLGQQVGELSSEVNKTREAMDDSNGSPVGTALKGLARRGLS